MTRPQLVKPQLQAPSVMPIVLTVMFWGPFALMLTAFGLVCMLTIIGIPLGLLALILGGGPIAYPIIQYNKKSAAFAVQGQPIKEAGHTVRPWDVTVTVGDTTAYEGWYNGEQSQGATGRRARG